MNIEIDCNCRMSALRGCKKSDIKLCEYNDHKEGKMYYLECGNCLNRCGGNSSLSLAFKCWKDCNTTYFRIF